MVQFTPLRRIVLYQPRNAMSMSWHLWVVGTIAASLLGILLERLLKISHLFWPTLVRFLPLKTAKISFSLLGHLSHEEPAEEIYFAIRDKHAENPTKKAGLENGIDFEYGARRYVSTHLGNGQLSLAITEQISPRNVANSWTSIHKIISALPWERTEIEIPVTVILPYRILKPTRIGLWRGKKITCTAVYERDGAGQIEIKDGNEISFRASHPSEVSTLLKSLS